MSVSDNIQTTKSAYAAFKRGDRAAMLAVCAEDLESLLETGAGELPQFPTTWVVAPCLTALSASPSCNRVLSLWVCMSMKPGQTMRLVALITRRAVDSERFPIAAMRAPLMPRS